MRGERALGSVKVVNHESNRPTAEKRVSVSNSSEIVAAGPQGGMGLDDHIYQRLLKERIIFLGSDVRDDNANAIAAQMLLLAAEDPEKDIWLYINSPGGSVTAGMAIFDTMQWVPNDVCTVAMGLAASMGQFLLSAGAKGKRYALPHADAARYPAHLHLNLLPEARGTGAAAALLAAGLDAMREHRLTHAWLGTSVANHRANAFYEKVGFRRVGARRFMVAGTPEEDNVRLTAL